MKVLSNTDNKPIIYKDHVIPPKGQILLDDKGEVIENFTDNSAEIEKLRKEVKEDNTKKSKNDENRFEELESEISEMEKKITTNLEDPEKMAKYVESAVKTYFPYKLSFEGTKMNVEDWK